MESFLNALLDRALALLVDGACRLAFWLWGWCKRGRIPAQNETPTADSEDMLRQLVTQLEAIRRQEEEEGQP